MGSDVVVNMPHLANFGNTLKINEPHLATMKTVLSMQPGHLAKASQSMSLGTGRLNAYRNYYYLKTNTKPLIIPTYCYNRPGHLLRGKEKLKMAMPRSLQIKCKFNVRKQGLLLNYPNRISVEGEESYTLKRVPEKFIYKTGALTSTYPENSRFHYATGKLKLIPETYDEKLHTMHRCIAKNVKTKMIKTEPQMEHVPCKMKTDAHPVIKHITSSFKYYICKLREVPTIVIRRVPHLLELGSTFKLRSGRRSNVSCHFYIGQPKILDFDSTFEINQDLECEGEIGG